MNEFKINRFEVINNQTFAFFKLRPRSPIFVNAGAVKRRADVFAQ